MSETSSAWVILNGLPPESSIQLIPITSEVMTRTGLHVGGCALGPVGRNGVLAAGSEKDAGIQSGNQGANGRDRLWIIRSLTVVTLFRNLLSVTYLFGASLQCQTHCRSARRRAPTKMSRVLKLVGDRFAS